MSRLDRLLRLIVGPEMTAGEAISKGYGMAVDPQVLEEYELEDGADLPQILTPSLLEAGRKVLPLRWPDSVEEAGILCPERVARSARLILTGPDYKDLDARHPLDRPVVDAIKRVTEYLGCWPDNLLEALLGAGLCGSADDRPFRFDSQILYAQKELEAEAVKACWPVEVEIKGTKWKAAASALYLADGPQPTHYLYADKNKSNPPNAAQASQTLSNFRGMQKTPVKLPPCPEVLTGEERVSFGEFDVGSRFYPLLVGRKLVAISPAVGSWVVLAMKGKNIVAAVAGMQRPRGGDA